MRDHGVCERDVMPRSVSGRPLGLPSPRRGAQVGVEPAPQTRPRRTSRAPGLRSQIPAFVDLYHRIRKHRAGIVASVTHGLSNGPTESINTKLRLLTRITYGFRSTNNLIALCLLDRGGHCPPLPGRT